MSLVVALLASAVVLSIASGPVRAATYPSPAFHFDGTVAGERFGTSVLLMDLNRDGVADLIVGAPYNGSSAQGSVTFYLSAKVGSTTVPFANVITTFGWADSLFGFSLANVGDVARKGATLAVGAPGASPNGHSGAGNVTLFYPWRGFDGKSNLTLNSANTGEGLGYSLAPAGDVNGDGFDDILAGAPFCNSGIGCAYIFFGASTPRQTPAMTFTTTATGALFGFSVAGDGTVDGNSLLDIAVGAPGQTSSTGVVYVIRNLMGAGGTGNKTTSTRGANPGDAFGSSVAMGDFNGDTFSDVAVGAPGANSGAGTVSIIDGGSRFNGAIGTTLDGAAGESFGSSVAAGNFHRDQFADLIVGAPASTLNVSGTGRAYAFYGGSVVGPSANLTLVPSSGDRAFGSSVAAGDDFNQDGAPDFAVGDAQFNPGSLRNAGRAYVYAGDIAPTLINPVILGWVCVPGTWKPSTKTCIGLPNFVVTLESAAGVSKTFTSLANGSFKFDAVPGAYFVNTTLFPYIDNSTTLDMQFNGVYAVLVFPLKIPVVFGVARDAVNRTAYQGVTVALYNATGALVNVTTTPANSTRVYSMFIPKAFLPAVGASLGLRIKMWDGTHYTNATDLSLARNQTVNESMFLHRFPVVTGLVRDVTTLVPISGATVQATQGTTVIAVDTTDAQGLFSFLAVNASVPATLFLNVTVRNYARGQVSRMVNRNATYNLIIGLDSDRIAPTSQISPLLPTYTTTAIVPIAVTATDNLPDNVAQVQLYYRFNNTGNFALYGTDTSAPFAFGFNTTATRGDGRYAFYTIATDYGGNRQATPPGNMSWTIVDTRSPSSSLAALPTYETVANFTVTATAFDWNAIQHVGLYYRHGTSGAYTLLSYDSASPYRWSFNTTQLGTGDGTYQFYSLATDAAGNVEAVPSAPDAATTVDSTPPAVTITAPSSGAVVGTGWVNVTWTATDATSGLAKSDVRLDTGAWVHAGTGLYHNFTGVSEGSHTVYVNATDNAGNSKTVSVTFTVSTVTPVVTISAPAAGVYITQSSLQVTWSVSNTGAGLSSVQVRLDGGTWQILAGSATSYTFTSVSDGAHTVSVQAVGMNGAQGTASVSVTVDATPPVATISAPAPNTWFTSAVATLSFSTSDAGSGILRAMLALDGGTAVNVTGMTSYGLTGLSDGSHTVILTATDKAGNTGSASVTFKVDTIAPTVTISSPTQGASLAPGDVTVAWTAADGGSGIAQVQISVDGGAFQTVTGASTVVPGLAAGNHTITVRVTDVAGNQKSTSVTFAMATSTGGPTPGLDPLVIAGIAIGIVVIIAAAAIVVYMRRKRTKTQESPGKEPEEQEKKGGET